MDDRYQHQSFWVKRLRDLWLLMIPYWAVRSWIREQSWECPNVYGIEPLSFKVCWSVACGMCDLKRNWVYTGAELEARQAQRAETSYKITFHKAAGLIWVLVDSVPEWIGCGFTKKEAIQCLRHTIKFSRGSFYIGDWWLSRRVKFSKTGKL